MREFSWRTRQEVLERLPTETFDLLIIGGGITGAGLALDGAVRGFNVALVEKRDFAAGTSSRSTKLIHGGLRYLEHFDFALVREGLRERAILLDIAPHLAEPFPFLIPIYKQRQRNYDRPLLMRAGLWLYDLLAGKYGIEKYRRISLAQTLRLAPQLDTQGLRGGFLYYDALTNDSRLVIDVIKTAHEYGAAIANYTEVVGFLHDNDGKIAGVHLRDLLTGREMEARARVVINATGVWMEDVTRLDATHAQPNHFHRVRPSKGIHLTVAAERLMVKAACLIPALNGHRFYFVVPWQGRINIGTTDTDYQGDKDMPRAEVREVEEILAAINAYFPDANLQPVDVISSWAGLRPLIGESATKATTDVSRKEFVLERDDGLISIAGGKLTTYRHMAEHGINLALLRLYERFRIKAKQGVSTVGVKLVGAIKRKDIEGLAQQLAANSSLTLATSRHLVHTYGTEAQEILEIMRQGRQLLQSELVNDLPDIGAEIVYAARYEMAMTLSDALARRTRLLMLDGAQALTCAPFVANLMARELGWDEKEIKRQLALLRNEYTLEYAFD